MNICKLYLSFIFLKFIAIYSFISYLLSHFWPFCPFWAATLGLSDCNLSSLLSNPVTLDISLLKYHSWPLTLDLSLRKSRLPDIYWQVTETFLWHTDSHIQILEGPLALKIYSCFVEFDELFRKVFFVIQGSPLWFSKSDVALAMYF